MFLSTVLHVENVEAVTDLVNHLSPGYAVLPFSFLLISTFYGLGKTHLILIQTLVANIFYIVFYDLIHQEVINLTLPNIVAMFNCGIGLAFVASVAIFYLMVRKKRREEAERDKHLQELE